MFSGEIVCPDPTNVIHSPASTRIEASLAPGLLHQSYPVVKPLVSKEPHFGSGGELSSLHIRGFLERQDPGWGLVGRVTGCYQECSLENQHGKNRSKNSSNKQH